MNATHGLPRRPGESPPNLAAGERAAAYFGGRLCPEDVETLQDDLAHDPDLAETLLDWQCFAPPSADSLPTATLTLWQSEDKARLDVGISEEREAREEAARLIGIPVEDLGRVPPPPAPTFSAEEQERARRAIERLRPLSATERLELVKREPEAFAGEAVASACLVEARAALPEGPRASGSWAEVVSRWAATGSTTDLAFQVRADLFRGNSMRCFGDLHQAKKIIEEAIQTASHHAVRNPVFWAEATSFSASIARDLRNFRDALTYSNISHILYDHLHRLREAISAKLSATMIHEVSGDLKRGLRTVVDAACLAQEAADSDLLLHAWHCRAVLLAKYGRPSEAQELLEKLKPEYLKRPFWEPGRLWVLGLALAGDERIGGPEDCLDRAQEIYIERGHIFNAALVTLDLTLLLLEKNRTDQVLSLAISMGKTFEALGVGRETLASWAILREAAERRELTQAIVRQVQEEISRPGAFRRVGAGAAGGGPLAKAEKLDHDLKGATAGPRTMDNVNRFPTPPGKTADSTDERSALYFAGVLSEAEAEKYQDQLAKNPELAESVLDWQAFSSPTADVVSPEELASWQAADRIRLQAAIEAEGKDAEVMPVSPVLQFPTATTAPAPKRHAWKWLAASAGLAAGLGGVMFATAPVPETYIVPVSTLRGDDDVTTLELGRWPHKALFRIDARTLGEIAEPQAALLDSMTDAVVATTSAKPCGEALCAQFWGLSPGNYRLELNDLATDQPRLVAYHPVELLATDRAP
ncbi:MAG: hypothetical protein SF066_22555 [Thermoanaerobaculia bacterium]|nr:hypothetical protein [Thermoanaerobaculia bacterium]